MRNCFVDITVFRSPGGNAVSYLLKRTGKIFIAFLFLLYGSGLKAQCPAVINTSPASQTAFIGCSVTFSVIATGDIPLSYQWQFNGTNIVGETFSTYTINPVTSGSAGNYTVVVISASCGTGQPSNIAVLTVNAFPTPTISASGPTTFCNGGSVTLTSSSATGNQWYKDGVLVSGETNQTYSATASGAYTVVVTASSCSSPASAATNVTVTSIPATPTISASGPTTFCAGGNVILTSSSATGNQWYKDGILISGETNQTYSATANGGYTLIITTSGCSSSASAITNVIVNALPTVTCPANSSVCINAAAYALTGGSPAGGTYSGTGVSGGNFNPATAGAGVKTITYTYTDPATSCTNSCTFTITVNALPVVNCPANSSVCINAAAYALTGGSPAGGTYSGTGVSGGNFNPATAGAGVKTITYTYTDPATSCTNSCTFTITVTDLPNNVSSSGFTGSTICAGSPGQLTFDANNSNFNSGSIQYTDGTTTWTQTIPNNSAYPFSVAVNPTITTTYSLVSITNELGCTRTSGFIDLTAPIVVNQLPNNVSDVSGGFTGNSFCVSGGQGTLTFNADDTYFSSGSIQYTDGTTTWTQAIPNNSAYTFNVAVNPSGAGNHDYFLVSITNQNGCTRTSGFGDDNARITINQLPTTPDAGPDQNNCNNGSFTLAGNNPSIGNGAWSVVTGTATITTPTSPTSAVTGIPVGSSATLRWTITNGTCILSDDVILTNNALQVVTCPANSSVCIDAASFALTGGLPSGGTYSGAGVSSGNFNPATAGVGTHTITYTFTDGNSCANSCTFTITVNVLPTVNATPSTQTICSENTIGAITITNPNNVAGTIFSWTRDNTVNLTGIVASGSGNSISGTLTNTTNVQQTTVFTITATSPSGCTSTTASTVIVNPKPTVNATPASQTICSGNTITTIVLSGNVSGTTFNWTRDNTATVTGIAASGSGDISGTLTNTTNAPITVTFTITPTANSCNGSAITATVIVNPTPNAVATPASQTICSGSAITTIVLTGSVTTTTYNWIRDNSGTVTGIAASGSGNISGSLTNTTNAPVTVTFTITPTANGCPGTAITATVLVNPTPNEIATPASQTICSGSAITTIVLSGNVTGTTYNWTRDNTGTVTGIAASGSGDISGTLTNTTNAPVTVTFTITPTANSCPGTTITATILVNPTPNAVATPASQTICSANAITTIVLSGNVTGTTYNWTRDNTGTVTGIAASGSGDISGSLTNTTNAPVTVTFTITPTANGCPGTAITATVLVNPTPNAIATPASQTICSGSAITTIVLSGSVATTTYDWVRDNTVSVTGIPNSGSGNISGSLTNTTNAPVTVTFTITPTANGCNGTPIIATVLVNPLPTITLGPNPAICKGTPTANLTYSATTGSPNQYSVVYDAAAFAAGFVTNITNAALPVSPISLPIPGAVPAGVYNATFTVRNSSTSCTSSYPITITINANPTVTVNSASKCASDPAVTITATPTPAGTYNYVWTVPGGATNPGNVASFSATVAGTYSVIITDPATGCTGTGSGVLTINANPTVTVNSVTKCAYDPAVTIFASPSPAGVYNYSWTVPATATNPGNVSSFPATVDGTYTVVISNTTTGCTGTGSGTLTVNPTPAVNAVSNQTVCNGASTTAVTFSGTGTSYTWTNNTTSIGLAASGTGDIPAFTATNTGSSPVTATIIVTPHYTNNSVTCNGPTQTFTITVNPTASVNSVSNQTVCNGSSTTAITFSGTATSYSWTNNTTSIGLAASGTGNIPAFTATNTGSSPVTATIVVTPHYTNNSVTCDGPTQTFTITVNPTPSVNAVGSQTVCNGALTTAITFGGTGTSYSWTNNTTSIGLAASGTGNIAVFTAINAGSSPVTATIIVTPQYTNGSVTCNGPTETFTITVNPAASVNAISNQTICNGASTAAITFSGTATSFSWTNNTTSIGLAASGTGNIPAFTATNTSSSPVTATIIVTPHYTNGSVTCDGPTQTFTITVNPTPSVNAVSNQTVCHGTLTTAITFGGTGTSYSWTNNTTSIGLAASGTGNIPAFTATNTGSSPVTATIIVTPHYTNASVTCDGPTQTFTITVNPNGTITLTSAAGTNAQTVCINNAITNITYAIGGNATGASISAGSLPAGVTGSFAGGVFTISGTPTIAGTFPYTVTTTGSACNNPSLSGTITVTANPTITLTSAAGTNAQTVCISTAITSITYAIGGSGTGASITAGALPAGVTGSFAAGVFTISGTPSVAGTFNYTITTTGPCVNATASGTITVTPNSTITLTSAVGTNAQNICIGNPITNITYAIGGSGTGASITAGALPTGVTGAFAGGVFTISGTPSVSGVFNYTVTTTGPCGNVSASGTITVTANATITLTSAAGTIAQTVCISTPITAITYLVGGGGTGAGVTGLPTGVTGNYNSGTKVFTISGTPTVSGTFNYTVTTTGACVNATATGTITVNANSTITLTSGAGTNIQTACVGNAISNITYAIGGGGTGATVVGLPAGVTGSFAGGVFTISGTPTVAGTFNYTVTTTGPCNNASATGTITVPTLPTTSNAGPDQTICAATPSTTLAANTPGAGSSGAWTIVSGPNTSTAQISNLTSPTATFTPTGGPGTYTLRWTISKAPCTASFDEVNIIVNPQPVVTVITDFCITPGKVVLTASPAFSTYQWSLNGTPISGATTQSITVDIAGIYSVNVTDAFGCTAFGSNSVSNDLVTNGSFTSGNTGFTNGYTYYPDIAGNNELVPDNGTNGYGVGTNGQNYHPQFWGFDHTNNTVGPRNFMLVNGHGTLNVWSTTVNVVAGTTYYFSAWAMSLNNVGPFAQLQFNIAGTQIGTTAVLAPGVNNNTNAGWIRFYGTWLSTITGPITISIVDLETAATGNDFGIDDVSFGTLDPLPITAAPTAGNNGAACLGQTTTLSANITGGKPPITYAWTTVSGPNTPTITTPNAANSTVTGLVVGNYVFQVSVQDGYYCPAVVKTVTLTVNPAISLTGNLLICPGQTSQLTGTPPPAASNPWVSATPSVATVNNSGLVTGVSAGSSVISYTNNAGCVVTATMVVDQPTITGGLSVCVGSTTQLAGSATAATPVAWTSASPGIATVSNTGLVTGIAAGTSVITYTNSNGCSNTVTITVNANPTATGVTICQGGSGSLTSPTICPSGGTFTAGPNFAGTWTGNIVSGGSTLAWTNPGNIVSNNGAYATASVSSGGNVAITTHYLQATNFGFTIPLTATITGIQVSIERFSSLNNANYVRDNVVSLIKAGAVTGNNNAVAVNWSTTNPTVVNYGTVSDLWGTTWTPAQINAANFGVALSVLINRNIGNTVTASVDYIQITVTYTINGVLNWYTVSSGGTVVQTGSPFNPVADPEVVAAGGIYANLTNTNTPGTYTFYSECSTVPGCRTAVDFIINPTPIITGTLTVCQGSTTQLTGSGTPAASNPWTSATPAVATVSNTGLVTGVSAGTSVITYTNSNNCPVTATVTVNANPVTTGVAICVGGSGSLTANACPGGGTFTVGPNNAGTGANVTGVGTVGWNNSNNAITNNNQYATVALTATGVTTSNYLRTTNYGFIIPANATILGIEVTIGRFEDNTGSGNDVRDVEVRLLKAGTPIGNNKANLALDWPTSETAASYGNASDLWGTTWTVAEITAANFGVSLVANSDNNRTASVDYMQITVTYSIPGTLNWYTVSSGGTVVQTGTPFNPVADPEVIAAGGIYANLTNSNTPGTYTFWAECASAPGCRTATNFVINPNPVVTTTNACIGGGTVTFTQTGAAAGGVWTVSGGGTINAGTGELTPTTAGCFTATYTAPTTTCFNTSSFVVFPAAPVLANPTNACNTAFTLPAVTTVPGFTIQYSIDGAAFTATPTIPTTPGCHSIVAQYVLTATCGATLAGATGSGSCGVSNTVNVVIFPTAPPAPVVNAGCGPIVVTPPASIAGFNIEYSFDNGTSWGANTPPTADNCAGYQIRTRYTLATACGSIAAGTAGTGLCAASPAITRILDQTAPVITTAAGSLDATLECSNAAGLAAALAQVPAATDNCTATPTILLVSDVTTPGSCANSYTRVRTWNFTDPCNNTSVNFTQTIIVQDITAPVITTAAGSLNVTLQCSDAAGLTAALAQAPVATDNCTASPTINLVSDVTTAGSCANSYTRVRTWNFTDACNNTSVNFTQTITVQDNTAPVWTTAAGTLDRTVECDDAAGLTAAQGLSPVATDNCSTVTITKTFGSFVPTACGGTFTNTWVAVDVCSNTSAVFTQVITITDTTAPVWSTTANALNVSVECSNAAGLTAAQAQSPVATDNCSSVTYTKTSGAFVPGVCGGTYTNTWVAKDICNNTSTVFTQIITITDNTAPVWTTAADALNVSVQCGDVTALNNAQAMAPVAVDACGTVTITKTSGAFVAAACGGTYTNTWVAVDGCGNISVVFTQVITITDNTPPTVTGTAAITIPGCNPPTPSSAFITPTATDNCGTPTLKSGYPVDGAVTPGANCTNTQTRTWIYVDACGNESAPFIQTITWTADAIVPTVTGTAAITIPGCNPPTPSSAFITPTATDNCGTPTLKSGYPVDGAVTPGANCTNTQTRTWIYVDACGNESVPFIQTITWTADAIVPTVTGTAAITIPGCNPATPSSAFITPTATDNCGTPTLKSGYPVDGAVTPGANCTNTQTRTWIYVDACGNESVPFIQTITWTADAIVPTVTGTAAITIPGCNPPTPSSAFITPTATDNCGTPTLKSGYPVDGAVTPGANCTNTQTRTWIYVDACGNESAPFIQTITWTADAIVPTVTGTAAITIPGCNPPTPSSAFITPTATDNCGTPTLKSGYPVDGAVTPGANCTNTQTRTWIYVDACGNESAPFIQTITWTADAIVPTVTGTAAITIPGCNPATPSSAFITPTATDNCGTPTLKSGYPVDGAVTPGANCTNTQTRTWIYVDACGNESAPFIQTITWTTDVTPPTITCPPPQTFCVVASNTYTIPLLVATDNCSGTLTITYQVTGTTTASGSGNNASSVVFNLGVSIITWTVTDACGNVSTCQTTITINPKPPPITITHN